MAHHLSVHHELHWYAVCIDLLFTWWPAPRSTIQLITSAWRSSTPPYITISTSTPSMACFLVPWMYLYSLPFFRLNSLITALWAVERSSSVLRALFWLLEDMIIAFVSTIHSPGKSSLFTLMSRAPSWTTLYVLFFLRGRFVGCLCWGEQVWFAWIQRQYTQWRVQSSVGISSLFPLDSMVF